MLRNCGPVCRSAGVYRQGEWYSSIVVFVVANRYVRQVGSVDQFRSSVGLQHSRSHFVLRKLVCIPCTNQPLRAVYSKERTNIDVGSSAKPTQTSNLSSSKLRIIAELVQCGAVRAAARFAKRLLWLTRLGRFRSLKPAPPKFTSSRPSHWQHQHSKRHSSLKITSNNMTHNTITILMEPTQNISVDIQIQYINPPFIVYLIHRILSPF